MLPGKEHRKLGLNARHLQWLALILMLIDHAAYAFFDHDGAAFFCMKCVGRLAFPIFAFQIAEGCLHTSNLKRYALRLAMFGVLSEIPFNMMHTGMWPLDPSHQNVMFTLLLGLVSLKALLWACDKSYFHIIAAVAVFSAAYFVADYLKLDYGGLGVATVVMFGMTKELKGRRLIQILLLGLLNFAMVMKNGSLQMPIQMLAVLAMLPICLYNGARGSKNKILQYAAYLFYPAHMSVLVIVRYMIAKLF